MKKIALIVMAMFSFTWLTAQVEKGSMYVGGAFEINNRNEEEGGGDFKVNTLTIVPNFGYFLSDKVSIGLGIGYSHTAFKNTINDNKTSNSQFLIRPNLRYYLATSNEKFYFFGQLQFGLGFGQNKQENGNLTITSKSRSFLLSLSPHFIYFPTKRWGVEMSFRGISYESFDPDKDGNNDRESRFIFGISSLSPSFSVNYFF